MGDVKIDAFYAMPEWLMTTLFVVVMVVISEIGYKLGLTSRVEEKTKSLVPIVAGSILAVMALLLGFTMSMSVSRFDVRRLVAGEASAIKTAYLRMQALPAPESTELEELLRQYADSRLRVSQNVLNTQILQQGRKESARLQAEMWLRAVALARNDPHSVTAGLLMQSLNNAFDAETARWVSYVANVPESVVYLNAVMGLVASLLVGYEFGLTGHRHLLSTAMLIFSITLVMSLIVGLDRPHTGVIRVSQQPLVDVQQELAAPSH